MISDEMLWVAATEADQLILNALPDPSVYGHTFSRSFERKMERLIRRAEHPIVHKVLKSAAIFILVCSMLFAGLLAVSPEVRASVVEWMRSVQTGISRYFYASNEIAAMDKEYYLSYIPEGYSYVDELNDVNGKTYIYANKTGQYLRFHYSRGSNSSTFVMYTEHCKHSTALVGATPVELYLAREGYQVSSSIVWENGDSILFIISAYTDEAGLTELAEGVKEK